MQNSESDLLWWWMYCRLGNIEVILLESSPVESWGRKVWLYSILPSFWHVCVYSTLLGLTLILLFINSKEGRKEARIKFDFINIDRCSYDMFRASQATMKIRGWRRFLIFLPLLFFLPHFFSGNSIPCLCFFFLSFSFNDFFDAYILDNQLHYNSQVVPKK